MDELDTATEALQQAFKENSVDGDVEASSKEDGQDHSISFNEQPKKEEKKDTAEKPTNEEAKKKRISDEEWQQRTEQANEAKALKEKLLAALSDAPEEVKEEQDVASQVASLKEMVERQAWEQDHPIVKQEKYQDAWKTVNSDPSTKQLSYDQKWKLIKDDVDTARGERLKEELKAQNRNNVSVPPVSKGSVQTGSESSTMARDYLKKAGFTDADIENSGVKL